MKTLYLFLFLFLPLSVFSQKITGIVINKTTQEPLKFAHVFLNNLSKGTTTNEQGKFTLSVDTQGNYELVASYIGYETFVLPIKVTQDTDLKIELLPQTMQLQEIVVQEDKHWRTNYETFLRDFLGEIPNSKLCKIKNPEVLQIVYEIDSNFLHVTSQEAIIIENKALGYQIKYFLQDYRKYFRKNNYTAYYGFMFFEEMKPKNKRQAKKWQTNRQEAWQGSLQHFLQSLYKKNYETEKFLVRRIQTVPTDRKPEDTIKRAIKSLFQKGFSFDTDTVKYWLKEQRKPIHNKYLITTPLPPDSLSYWKNEDCMLSFKDELQVSYLTIKETGANQVSQITLRETATKVEANGILQNPLAITLDGHWAWREKISNFLPHDYKQ
jgi:hypothetical protein